MDVDLAYADRNPVSRSRRERQGWRSPVRSEIDAPGPVAGQRPGLAHMPNRGRLLCKLAYNMPMLIHR